MYSKLFYNLAMNVSGPASMVTITVSDTRDYGGAILGTSYDDQPESPQPVFVVGTITTANASPNGSCHAGA